MSEQSSHFAGNAAPGLVGGPGSVIPAAANPLAVLAEIAHTQIGVHEVGGENRGPQIRAYQAATSEPGTGWPWCAAFVCWCVRELTKIRPGLLSCEVHKTLPRNASVEALIDWGRNTGQLVWSFYDSGTARVICDPTKPGKHQPQAGDIACMRFGSGNHVGIVTGPVYDTASGWKVHTIEGNTSGPYRAKQDERNGGEVAAKDRGLFSITHFIRLTLEAEPVTKPVGITQDGKLVKGQTNA